MINVIHYVSVMDRAGQETFLRNLMRRIDPEQMHFDFLCTEQKQGAYDREIEQLGGRVYHTKAVTARGPAKQLQKFRYLRCALKAHPCDVFHIHTHHAMDAFRDALAACCSGVKTVVVHSHNTDALYHRKAHRVFRRLLCLLPVKHFACSRAAGQWMFCGDDFRVIHNALDLEQCHFDASVRNRVRSQMHWEGKKIVGHVGRFNEQKNHAFLLEIFARLHEKDPQTHLVLVGKGELQDPIRQMTQRLGLSEAVSFLGIREDVIPLYQGMDLLLFPSLFEGLSVVLTEAQACDLPCLASDTNSPESVLTERIHMWPLEKSADSWAEEALRLLEDLKPRTDRREQMRRAGYDVALLAQELKTLYTGK